MNENQLAYEVIGQAMEIHSGLGPGLLEKVYTECLFHRLSNLDLDVAKEFPIPVCFENVRMDCGYRADLIVEGKLIVEIKSIEAISDIHLHQVLTYLRFSGCKLGLILNFNVSSMKKGIKRVVNGLE